MTRTRWALLWIAAVVSFAGGVFWPLTVETEAAYALSIVLVLPLMLLILVRPPGWLSALSGLPGWLKFGAALIPLEAAMAFFILSDGSYDGYFLVGIGALPLLLLIADMAIRSEDDAPAGADAGGWGPPGGFDG